MTGDREVGVWVEVAPTHTETEVVQAPLTGGEGTGNYLSRMDRSAIEGSFGPFEQHEKGNKHARILTFTKTYR